MKHYLYNCEADLLTFEPGNIYLNICSKNGLIFEHVEKKLFKRYIYFDSGERYLGGVISHGKGCGRYGVTVKLVTLAGVHH